MKRQNSKLLFCSILGNACLLVLLGVQVCRERRGANAAQNDVFNILNNYTQMRVEMTSFANAIAEYFYVKGGGNTRNYYIFKPTDSDEFFAEKQLDLDNEKAIYLIGVPTSAGCKQSVFDMCLSYDMRMLNDSMASCKEDWTALSNAIQLCYPELWSLWEKEYLTAGSHHLQNRGPMISVKYIESLLSKSFRQMDGIFIYGNKGTDP